MIAVNTNVFVAYISVSVPLNQKEWLNENARAPMAAESMWLVRHPYSYTACRGSSLSA